MASTERDFLERLERNRMQDIRRVAASTPQMVERERDILDRVEDFLGSKEGIALSLAPQASIPVGLAETTIGLRNRDIPQTGLGLLGLLPFVGGTIRNVVNKSGKMRRVGTSWRPGMTQREAQKAARDREFRIKKNEWDEFVVTDPNDPSFEYFAGDLEEAVTTMDFEANRLGR
jgi:hypothetical protein